MLPWNKRRTLINAFTKSQFSFSTLGGMFFSRELNIKLTSLHHRAFKIVYRNENLSSDELLKVDSLVSVHHKYFFQQSCLK